MTKHVDSRAWINHPLVPFEECEEIVLINDATGLLVVRLYVIRKEGFWMTGYYAKVGDAAMWQGSFVKVRQPSKKYGMFDTYHEAMEDVLNFVINIFIAHAVKYTVFPVPTDQAMKVLQQKKAEIQGEQLNLFKS